jgi:YHS domain-containing protein
MRSPAQFLGQDPMCGMRLSEEQVIAVYEYFGRTYVFCSTECRDLFAAAPERTIVFLAHSTDEHCAHRCPQQRGSADMQ